MLTFTTPEAYLEVEMPTDKNDVLALSDAALVTLVARFMGYVADRRALWYPPAAYYWRDAQGLAVTPKFTESLDSFVLVEEEIERKGQLNQYIEALETLCRAAGLHPARATARQKCQAWLISQL